MPVTKNDSGTNFEGSAAGTSASLTGFSVEPGSDLFLLGFLFTRTPSGISGTTMTWDYGGTDQSMTSVTTVDLPSNHRRISVFKLIAPATGNKIMHAEWTGSTDELIIMTAIAFKGVDNSTGINGAHTQTNSGTATSDSLTITGSTDGATVAVCWGDNTMVADTGTEFFNISPYGIQISGTYTIGGTSNNHDFSWGTFGEEGIAGVHVLAGFTTPRNWFLKGH